MKSQALVNANSVERWSFEDVVEKRAVSRFLLNMLIEDSNYKLAAEMVIGAADVFHTYAMRVEGLNRANPRSVGDFQSLLITCRAEIKYQQKWSELILQSLSNSHGAQVLIAAFATANGAAASLLQIVEKYEEAHVDVVL